MDRRRTTVVAASALTVLALLALAAGLSNLDLGAGTSLPTLDPFSQEGISLTAHGVEAPSVVAAISSDGR